MREGGRWRWEEDGGWEEGVEERRVVDGLEVSTVNWHADTRLCLHAKYRSVCAVTLMHFILLLPLRILSCCC